MDGPEGVVQQVCARACCSRWELGGSWQQVCARASTVVLFMCHCKSVVAFPCAVRYISCCVPMCHYKSAICLHALALLRAVFFSSFFRTKALLKRHALAQTRTHMHTRAHTHKKTCAQQYTCTHTRTHACAEMQKYHMHGHTHTHVSAHTEHVHAHVSSAYMCAPSAHAHACMRTLFAHKHSHARTQMQVEASFAAPHDASNRAPPAQRTRAPGPPVHAPSASGAPPRAGPFKDPPAPQLTSAGVHILSATHGNSAAHGHVSGARPSVPSLPLASALGVRMSQQQGLTGTLAGRVQAQQEQQQQQQRQPLFLRSGWRGTPAEELSAAQKALREFEVPGAAVWPAVEGAKLGASLFPKCAVPPCS